MKSKNILLIVFTFFLAGACGKETPKPSHQATTEEETPETDTTEMNPDKSISYLALGDSYTIGESVAETERFPVLLAKELRKEGLEVEDPQIIATTGWTTGDLKRGIERAAIEGKEFELVSLLIGVNNQYQGKELEDYKAEFKDLLQQAIEFANGNKNRVLVISIPDYGYTPFGESRQEEISAALDLFNAANKHISDSTGVKYFNITPISRKGLSEPELVASDGLHPSGKMYQQWVDLMKEDVLESLR